MTQPRFREGGWCPGQEKRDKAFQRPLFELGAWEEGRAQGLCLPEPNMGRKEIQQELPKETGILIMTSST